MGDAPGGADGLHIEALLKFPQPVPEALPPPKDAAEIAERIRSGILAQKAVPAAICVFLSHPDSFTRTVTLAIIVGGDTYTIAAMTGALSGALLGESAIPQRWIDRAKSAPRMRQLADDLFTQAQRRL